MLHFFFGRGPFNWCHYSRIAARTLPFQPNGPGKHRYAQRFCVWKRQACPLSLFRDVSLLIMSQQRPAVQWMWENDAGTAFNNFDPSDCDLLEYAHRTNAQVLQHSTKPWIFDLAAMTETNTISSAKRNVKRMDPSSAPVGHHVADAAAAQAQQLPALSGNPSPVQTSTHNSSAPLSASDNQIHYQNAFPNLTHWGVPDAPQQLTGSDGIVDASHPAAVAIAITDECKVLGRILHELGALHLLQEFIDLDQKDSKLAALCQSSPKVLARLYSMSEATAVQFIKMCRHASMPIYAGHERWLKACLILRACAIGVRPFVGAVMKQLHNRVVNEVRETISEFKSECDDSEWKCDNLQEKDLAFDERPSVLQVVSLQHDGAATTDLPHRLSDKHAEPFFLSKRNTKGIFSKEGLDGFGLSNLFMRSLPADALASKVESERRFVMQNVCKWSTPYLKPFQVHREDGRDSYTVVYCQCKIDEAPRLVVTAGG